MIHTTRVYFNKFIFQHLEGTEYGNITRMESTNNNYIAHTINAVQVKYNVENVKKYRYHLFDFEG